MVLDKIVFINRAPFEHMEIDFLEGGINVLSAINGKGKTTILSHIVDAFHELAKKAFPNSYKGNLDGAYYRVLTSRYSLDSTKPAIVYIRFKKDDNIYDFVEIVGSIDNVLYDSINIENKIPYFEITKKLSYSAQAKILSTNCTEKNIKSIFNKSLATYFPAYRFETPGYLNNSYSDSLLYDLSRKYNGYIRNPIEVVSGLPQLANWLMDLVLDWSIYKDSETMQLRTAVNKVLSLTLSSKTKMDVRLGIGPRTNTSSRISIVHDEGDKIQTVYPSIFEISSGEAALLCMFGEILRQSDAIGETLNCEGIVIIDEIDKHLHITIQHDILPQLFKLFPRVQFIVSSHSPFLTMGLAEMQQNRTRLIDLDNDGMTTIPQNTEIFQSVYEMFVNENNNFAKELKSLKERIDQQCKPIIITEGKTDIKHIMKAKEVLKITDVDFACIEVDQQPDGDTNLLSLLDQLSKVSRSNIVIGIFDRDNDKILKDLQAETTEYLSFGNNVYGFCIPVPKSRLERKQRRISIEYLYSDNEITQVLSNGCRLFFGTEFSKQSMFHNAESLTLKVPKGKGEDKIIENNGGQAVYDNDDKNHLAKKNDFANAVVNEEIAIAMESWNNFKPIFDILHKILQLGCVKTQ